MSLKRIIKKFLVIYLREPGAGSDSFTNSLEVVEADLGELALSTVLRDVESR